MNATAGRHFAVSVLGYGDALITLALARQAAPQLRGLELVGTPITRRVLHEILEWPELPFTELLPDHAAFFRLREAGLTAGLRELARCRRWARTTLRPDDRLLLEKSDLRNRFAFGAGPATLLQPPRALPTYAARATLWGRAAGVDLVLAESRFVAPPRRVLVNPAARAPHRTLGIDAVQNLVRVFAEGGAAVTLIDPEGRFAAARTEFAQYVGRVSLREATSLMRAHDLYVGPDSFFIHLAYYCGLPFLAVLPQAGFDFRFAPPGTERLGHTLTLAQAADPQALREVLRWTGAA